MQRIKILIITILTLLMIGIVANAQDCCTGSIPSSWVSGPSFGMGTTIPLWISLAPSGNPSLTTALTFFDLFAQVPLTLDFATRTTLRFYVSSTLRLDLTSGQQSLLLFLNRGPARLYTGVGIGIFPYEDSDNTWLVPGLDPGFLLSLHYLGGMRFNVAFFSIFGELMYEVMPQPVALSDPAIPTIFGSGILSSFELTIGGQIHFSPACIPACAKIEKPAPPPCTPPC